MAHHHSGQTTEARRTLDLAAETIERWMQQRYAAAESTAWAIHQGATTQWPVAWWDWLECQLLYREAKLLIDGTLPPDDARSYVLRARGLAGLRRHARADAEYAGALRLAPEDSHVRLEAHRCAGYSAIGKRKWDEAASEFAQAGALAPDDTDLWNFRAVALLAAEDLQAYRQTCRAMLDRFEGTGESHMARGVVYACVLRADALNDAGRLLPMVEVASQVSDVAPNLRGAALYRAGNYSEAVRSFEEGNRIAQPRAWDWAFLAMAYTRMGNRTDAHRCLAEAVLWINEADRQTIADGSGLRPAWGGWYERVVYPLLLREAEELLNEL